MTARVNASARIQLLQAIELENDWLLISILPGVGAKIYDLVWKPSGRNSLWHNPRIVPQTYPIESNFDNYWCGGWDDGFPTCEECDFRGEHYPNLGELRSLSWLVDSVGYRGGNAFAQLSSLGPISPAHIAKTITLSSNFPVVQICYEITNLGPLPLNFIWGTHPALAPTAHMILRIPAKTGIVGLASSPTFGTAGQIYSWPLLESAAGSIDMSRVQGVEAKAYCGHYVTDLEAGWYAVEDIETGSGFLLKFPVSVCKYLWLWLVYGGWRGYHHVIVEPWTSYPINLAEAVHGQTSRYLEPNDKFSVKICASLYTRPETWREALKAADEAFGQLTV
jgi:hypothetical protein